MNREHEHEHDDEGPIAGLRQLARDAEPSRDLWPGIDARLAPRRRRVSANGWMSLAAAACVMAIVGLAFVRPHDAPLPRAEAPASVVAADLPDLRVVAGSRALVKANLQLSRSSETQIRRALQQDPDSASLHRLLLSTRARSEELHRMLAAQAT